MSVAFAADDGWRTVEAPPPGFVPVLLYCPEDAPRETVHEGYFVEGAGYRTHAWGKCYPLKWRPMPKPPEETG